MTSIAVIVMKYFLVHGGLSVTDGKSAILRPFTWKMPVNVGAISAHSHEVPRLPRICTSFLVGVESSALPMVNDLRLSMTMLSKTSKLAVRLPVLVSHGA